jgi:hypothetical protein
MRDLLQQMENMYLYALNGGVKAGPTDVDYEDSKSGPNDDFVLVLRRQRERVGEFRYFGLKLFWGEQFEFSEEQSGANFKVFEDAQTKSNDQPGWLGRSPVDNTNTTSSLPSIPCVNFAKPD